VSAPAPPVSVLLPPLPMSTLMPAVPVALTLSPPTSVRFSIPV
jgi:hypothetical protein